MSWVTDCLWRSGSLTYIGWTWAFKGYLLCTFSPAMSLEILPGYPSDIMDEYLLWADVLAHVRYIQESPTIEPLNYALQVPWNTTEKKFKCPCHGSQYNAEGKVVRGPAPLVNPLSPPSHFPGISMPAAVKLVLPPEIPRNLRTLDIHSRTISRCCPNTRAAMQCWTHFLPAYLHSHYRSTKLNDIEKNHPCQYWYIISLQSLALAHADVKDDVVFFSPWKETDFRTNSKPWWV